MFWSHDMDPYVIEAEVGDRNTEDVVQATEGLDPQQLHEHGHFLWQTSCVQPFLQQELSTSRSKRHHSTVHSNQGNFSHKHTHEIT